APRFRASKTRSATFFCSSRRRHTRLQGDWSSDVCSSDLCVSGLMSEYIYAGGGGVSCLAETVRTGLAKGQFGLVEYLAQLSTERSEERRVGKECRTRWSPER